MNNNIDAIRHSLAHLLAAAVLKEFPDAKLGIGPTIDNGFYYDFELSRSLTPDDLKTFEKSMKKMIGGKLPFSGTQVSADEAKELFKTQPFKLELIEEFAKDGKELTIYKTSDVFMDLCRGGHVENTSEISADAFTLERIAGAYWRGDENKPQLQRIYGLAFGTKDELDAYLAMRAEAEKRDHKMLGKKLSLFTFAPEIGSGLPLYMPKGNIVREELLRYITELKKAHGYSFVWTPHLAKKALYMRSGHLGKYDAMLPPIKTDDGEEFVLKPMNCPHHFNIYNAEPKSYKDLPFRIAENATDYRNEKSGELNGLFRVRSLTQDDTHHVIRHDQIASEIDMILGITREIYEKFAFKNFHVEISVRDPKNKEGYFGTDTMWNDAESALIEAAKRWGAPYKIAEGEAAFYGPKIDIRVEDAIGRTWQLTTVQLDYNQPENFDMTYIDDKGQKVRPAVIHAALLGSVDRFMGIIIEQFAGAFPVWLAPVQATILPVGEKFSAYGKKAQEQLVAAGIRAELSEATESLGKRIREAETMKIPYVVVVGEKEEAAGTVNFRDRKAATKESEQTEMKLEEFVAHVMKEIADRTL